MSEGLGIGIDWTIVNDDVSIWARKYSAKLVKGITKTTRKAVGTQLSAWIESGDPLPGLFKRLEGIYGRKRAELIGITEATKAYAKGNELLWKASAVVDRRQWNTAADELVCPICGPLNGQVRELGKPFDGGIDNPPAHPRCRCWITPVVVGEGKREAVLLPPEGEAAPYSVGDNRMWLEDLPQDKQNTVQRTIDDISRRYGVETDVVYQKGRRKSLARGGFNSDTGRGYVQLQKTFLRDPEAARQLAVENFRKTRAAKIKEFRDNKRKLEHWERVRRWAVYQDADDALEAVMRHELYHVVDGKSGWALRKNLGHKIFEAGLQSEMALVSEYGLASDGEFFAELGTAIDMGIDVPQSLIDIFKEVVKSAI